MKKTKVAGLLTLATGVALTLAACGNNNNSQSSDSSTDGSKFPKVSTNDKKIVQGGTYKIGVASNSPFAGIFFSGLSDDAIDSSVSLPGDESLFKINDSYTIVDGGATNLKLDNDKKTATLTIHKGLKWSDGKPVVANDLVYAYKIVANKASKSSRYTESLAGIVGIEDYHNGKTDEISGLETPNGVNGNKLVIHMKSMAPAMTQIGSGFFLPYAAPYHYLKDVPFADLVSSDKIRKHPLFFGPYKLSKLVRGQSVEWVPNEYYYQGKPHFDKVVISIVNTNNVAQSIKSHKFDQIEVPNSQWKDVKDTKKVEFVADTALGYSYLGFKVGKWDAAKGENVMSKNAKMGDKNLRRAIAYAMNVDQVYKKFSSGLSFRIPTLINEKYGKYFDKTAKGFPYNLKKANEILDKAGYKKKGTYRQTPDGKDLTIRLAAMDSSKTSSPIAQNYIQQWKKIGLKVVLATGRLIEFNSFYDKIQNDDPSIDMFMGAWSTTGEPSPNDLYNRKAPYNFTRFATKKNDTLLENIDSEKAFNTKYRVKQFHEWQNYMNKEAYVVPLSNSYSITAVNEKVVGFSTKPSSDFFDVGFSK